MLLHGVCQGTAGLYVLQPTHRRDGRWRVVGEVRDADFALLEEFRDGSPEDVLGKGAFELCLAFLELVRVVACVLLCPLVGATTVDLPPVPDLVKPPGNATVFTPSFALQAEEGDDA